MAGEMDGMMMVNDSGAPETGDAGAQSGQEAQEQQPAHHAQRQPRTERGQFNGPPEEQLSQPAKRKYKYTADRAKGLEVEEELTDEEVAQRLAMAKGFYTKAEEAAALKKQLDERTQVEQAAAGDPKSMRALVLRLMKQNGGDEQAARDKARDLITMTLHSFLEEDSLTPEQRRIRELEEREAERERQETEGKKQARVAEFSKAVEARRQEMVGAVKEAFAKASKGGLPVNEEALSVMGRHFLTNAKHGVGCTPDELVRVYEEHLDSTVGARLKNLTGEQLRARYPDLYRAVHKHLRDEAQRARKPGGGGVGAPRPKPAPTQRPAVEDSEAPIFFERLGSRG